MEYIRISPNVEYSTDMEFFLENQIICMVSKEGAKFLQPNREPVVHAFAKPPYQQADATEHHAGNP